MVDTRETQYGHSDVRLTPSALIVRDGQIPYDQVASVECGASPQLGPPSILIGVGVTAFAAFVTVLVIEICRGNDPWYLAMLLVMSGVFTGAGAVMRRRLKHAFIVRVRLRSGAVVPLASTRNEDEAAPLRDALLRAIAASLSRPARAT